MPRYIDADMVIASLGFSHTDELVQRKLDEQPTADVQPVKRGKWIPSVDRWGDIITTVDGYTCSDCGFFNAYEDRYCPNCGARMDGENDG